MACSEPRQLTTGRPTMPVDSSTNVPLPTAFVLGMAVITDPGDDAVAASTHRTTDGAGGSTGHLHLDLS